MAAHHGPLINIHARRVRYSMVQYGTVLYAAHRSHTPQPLAARYGPLNTHARLVQFGAVPCAAHTNMIRLRRSLSLVARHGMDRSDRMSAQRTMRGAAPAHCRKLYSSFRFMDRSDRMLAKCSSVRFASPRRQACTALSAAWTAWRLSARAACARFSSTRRLRQQSCYTSAVHAGCVHSTVYHADHASAVQTGCVHSSVFHADQLHPSYASCDTYSNHATHIRITSAIDVARAAQRGGGVSGRSAQQGTSRRICFSPGCPGTRYVDHCVGCRRRPHMGTGFLGLRILSLASTTRPSPCLSCRAGLPRRQCFDLRCPQEQHEQQGPSRSCLASLGLIHRLTSIGSAPIEDEEDGSLGWLSADLAS